MLPYTPVTAKLKSPMGTEPTHSDSCFECHKTKAGNLTICLNAAECLPQSLAGMSASSPLSKYLLAHHLVHFRIQGDNATVAPHARPDFTFTHTKKVNRRRPNGGPLHDADLAPHLPTSPTQSHKNAPPRMPTRRASLLTSGEASDNHIRKRVTAASA